MPRDDLSIDFVKRMPQIEPLDPGLILDDWINRVSNFPEEIRFLQEEIAEKDRQYSNCLRTIDDRDGKIQKWIKSNGSHEPNPKEDLLRSQIRDQYIRADQLAQEKMSLMQKLQAIMDKHLRRLDVQIKLLYDRAEPGFTDPDEVPSLLRPSAANHAVTPSARSVDSSTIITATGPVASPLNASLNGSQNPVTTRLPSHPHIRNAQNQQGHHQHTVSAPATPAASIILNRQREASAGPTTKRGPRAANTAQGTAPTASSNLARHSSLGPGTPRSGPLPSAGATVRAGSAGPRASSAKAGPSGGSRRGTPTSTSRRKPANKSSLLRVKKTSSKNSPTSTADSDLSEAVSVSGEEEEDGADNRSGDTSMVEVKTGNSADPVADVEEDEEAGDDKKYCLCHNVSYGDMVACDNDNCPYEWFHWSCVGLKSEPTGTWYCPVCAEKFQKKGK